MSKDIESDSRFKQLPGWAKFYSKNAGICKLAFFVGIPLASLFAGGPITATIVFGGLLAMGFRLIDSDPKPQVAISQILEKRLPLIYQSGFVFVLPFIEELLLIDVSDIDSDWTFKGVPTRRISQASQTGGSNAKSLAKVLMDFDSLREPQYGGSVEVKVQYSVTPDENNPWQLIDLLNKGGPQKALGFLEGIVGDDIRQAGRALTWQEYQFATDLVDIKLIFDATGYKGPGNQSIFDNPTPERIREYLQNVQENGVSEIRGSGFKVKTLSILSVKHEGKLADEAERVIVEDIKRKQLSINAQALRENMQTLKGDNPDGSINDEAALAALQAEDGTVKQTRQTIKISDGEKIAKTIGDSVALGLAAILKSTNKGG